MMPGMAPAQQVAQMRQTRPAGMQQQVRAAAMTSRPITGQQPVGIPPQRAGWSVDDDAHSDNNKASILQRLSLLMTEADVTVLNFSL